MGNLTEPSSADVYIVTFVLAGDFRLTEEFRHLEVPETEWFLMNQVDRKRHKKSLFVGSGVQQNALQDNQDALNPGISGQVWRVISEKAEEILARKSLSALEDAEDVFSVRLEGYNATVHREGAYVRHVK